MNESTGPLEPVKVGSNWLPARPFNLSPAFYQNWFKLQLFFGFWKIHTCVIFPSHSKICSQNLAKLRSVWSHFNFFQTRAFSFELWGSEILNQRLLTPHMLVSLAKMTLPVTFMMDVVVLIIVGSSILLVKYLASPTVLGFFCNDEVKTISMFHSSNNWLCPHQWSIHKRFLLCCSRSAIRTIPRLLAHWWTSLSGEELVEGMVIMISLIDFWWLL